jgi:hypothetical protein
MPRAKKAPSIPTKPVTNDEAPAKPVASVQPDATKAGVQTRTIGKQDNGNGARSNGDLEATIRQRAYELYEKRGRQDGLHNEDWLQAEREVKGQQQQNRRTA